jgi:type I restriction enzyme R subunit
VSHAYSEDQLVEQPAIQIFAEMGWQTVPAIEEIFGVGSTFEDGVLGETLSPKDFEREREEFWRFPKS